MNDLPEEGSIPNYQPPRQGAHRQQPQDYQQQPQPTPTYPPHYHQLPQYPEESGAVAALVVSILGLVMCSGIISPVGWVMANKELEAIREGRRDPTKRDMAKAAQIVSIIGSVLLGLFVLFFGGLIIVALIGAVAGA